MHHTHTLHNTCMDIWSLTQTDMDIHTSHTYTTHMHRQTYDLSYQPAYTYMHPTHTLHIFTHGHMVPHTNLHTHIHMHTPYTTLMHTQTYVSSHTLTYTHIPHINTHICYTHLHVDIWALKHTCTPLHPTLHHTLQVEKKREKRKKVNQVAQTRACMWQLLSTLPAVFPWKRLSSKQT